MFIYKNIFKSFLTVQKKNYATLTEKQVKERDSRHFAPANKEWKNSVYAYNKSNLYAATGKDKIASDLIKGYFNLVPKPIKTTRSKRRRDFLRRTSTKQLFVSKPEIKQNNNKAIITVYTHDREKVSYLKKLYLLNKWLNTNVLWSLEKNIKEKSSKYLIKKYSVNYLFLNRWFRQRRVKYRNVRNISKRNLSKYNIKHYFYKKTAKSLLNKKQFIIRSVYYNFFIWILSVFRIRISLVPNVKSVIIKKNKENKVIEIDVVDLILKKMGKRKTKQKNKVIAQKKITIIGKFEEKTLETANILLLQYLISNVNKILNNKQKEKIYSLFNIFRKKNFNGIVRKYLKKEVLIIKYLTKLYVNKFKFYSYLPGLKSLLSNLYDKKIQLNIVNLKYLHLNSDLFTEAVSLKLKDRTKSLLRILRKSFKLVRTYKPNNMFLRLEKEKNSVLGEIKTYFGEYNVINGNVLNVAFKEMFKNKNITGSRRQFKGLKATIKNVLTSLNYKWITGIRIEAKGRLTKRYAAARSVFKYKYRGTLKNLDHLKNIDNKLQSPNVSLLRGDFRPNIQYSFVPYKRRIGAFGIKSWISNS